MSLTDVHSWGVRATLLFAAALTIVALSIAVYTGNPVEEAGDQITGAARSVGVIEGQCPHGWSHNVVADHEARETCRRGSVVVTLYPYLNKANYGIDTMGGDSAPLMKCRDIPDWPESWCEQ